MKIESAAFQHEESIPSKYTCDGENVNPPLMISEVPEGAASLVLIMDDPDVPISVRPDGMWDHWLVFNIPPDTTDIAEDSVPDGVVGLSTSGVNEYGGPCPPDKEHRYFFKLYALDSLLELDSTAQKMNVEDMMRDHVLEKTELMGRYKRQQL